jgi:hypothetical protein
VVVGPAARPALALAVLAALERRGATVAEPLPPTLSAGLPTPARGARTVADVLAPPGRGRGTTRVLAALLRALTGREADHALEALVTGPLGVEARVVVGDGSAPRADAVALGTVLRAWVRLTAGDADPALALPTPAAVRAAWTRASRLVAPAGRRVPIWWGPGVVRNVAGSVAAGASPSAFGALGRHAVAVGDADRHAVAVVVTPHRTSAAALRRSAGDLLRRAPAPPRRAVGEPAFACATTRRRA